MVPPYTKDALPVYQVGEHTYGVPAIRNWGENAKFSIGKFCSIANGVTIFLGGEHRTDWVTTYPFAAFPDVFPESGSIAGFSIAKGDVVIGSDVWIGEGVTILSGVCIGHGAAIGAHSVVTKNVAPYAIVGGNPAHVLRMRFAKPVVDFLLAQRWWDWPIDVIRARIPELCMSPSGEGESMLWKHDPAISYIAGNHSCEE